MALVPLGIYGLYRVYREHNWHLFGHNYLGPGSIVNGGSPAVDKDDYAAFQHDINYDSLVAQAREYGISEKQFHETLEEIDHKTIGEFYREFKATGSWHSLLCHVGLRLKGLAEHVANRPLYPRQPLRRLGE